MQNRKQGRSTQGLLSPKYQHTVLQE